MNRQRKILFIVVLMLSVAIVGISGYGHAQKKKEKNDYLEQEKQLELSQQPGKKNPSNASEQTVATKKSQTTNSLGTTKEAEVSNPSVITKEVETISPSGIANQSDAVNQSRITNQSDAANPSGITNQSETVNQLETIKQAEPANQSTVAPSGVAKQSEVAKQPDVARQQETVKQPETKKNSDVARTSETKKPSETTKQTNTARQPETTQKNQETKGEESDQSNVVGKVTSLESSYVNAISNDGAYDIYSFDAMQNAAKYEIYKCEYHGEALANIESLNWRKVAETTETTYRDYSVEKSKTFLIRVRAVDTNGKFGEWSEVTEQSGEGYFWSFETYAKIGNITSDGMEVSWSPYTAPHQLKYYRVNILEPIGNMWRTIKTIENIPANQLSCRIDGLESGNDYGVTVDAVCEVISGGKKQKREFLQFMYNTGIKFTTK